MVNKSQFIWPLYFRHEQKRQTWEHMPVIAAAKRLRLVGEGDWRDVVLVDKSIDLRPSSSSESQHPHGCSQLPVTLVLGESQ